MMEKAFQFVDGSGEVDRSTRKLMRSHVMKGKNAGKTLNRRSRMELGGTGTNKGTHTYVTRQPPCGAAAIGFPIPNKKILERNNLERNELGPVLRDIGSVVQTFHFPVELGKSSLNSINHYEDGIYESYARVRTWLIRREASHCSLALMASTNEFFTNGGVSSPKALSYLSKTLSLVIRRMQGDKALSDSTLCMVMMLILQEQIRHEKTSQIHYEGLRRMIQLRGGIAQLESCPTLSLKISKMDILYALRYGEPLFFFRDHMPEVRDNLTSVGFNFASISAATDYQIDGVDMYLQRILLDVTSVAALFNHPPTGYTLDLNTFLEIVISICCRLIRFGSLQSPKPKSKRDAVYHIGLLTFMTTLFMQWDHRRVKAYESISQRLKDILEDGLDAKDNDLIIWLLFVSSLWFPTKSGDWLILKIKTTTAHSNINSWSAVLDKICKYPWIYSLHDQTGRRVWELVQGNLVG